LWQGNLDAQILVVGQDWGDVTFFEKNRGRDPSGNPTNSNLIKLLEELNVFIAPQGNPQENVIFLTNAILCLKNGGLQAKIDPDWVDNCINEFLIPLINLIKPKIVVPMSKVVTLPLLRNYNLAINRSSNYLGIINKSPYMIGSDIALFPVYHCGAGSINRNRSFIQQNEDWKKIGNYFKQNHTAK